MGLGDWLDLDAIKAITRHFSAAMVALMAFGLFHYLIPRVLEPGHVRTLLQGIDDFALIGIFFFLTYQMGVYLWNRRERVGLSALAV